MSTPDHLNIDQAKDLYQTWERQIPKGKEKDALNLLPKRERQAMAEVVDFIQKHDELLKAGSSPVPAILELKDHHFELMGRLGVDLNRLSPSAPPEKQEILDAFDQLLIRAAAKTLWPKQDNSSLKLETFETFLDRRPTTGQRLYGTDAVVEDYFKSILGQVKGDRKNYAIPGSARSAFFKAVLEEMEAERKAGTPLSNEWVQGKVKSLIGPVGRKAFSDGHSDLESTLTVFRTKFGEGIPTADFTKTSIDRRIANTASILKPLIIRDQRLYGAVAKAEDYNTFMSSKEGLKNALSSIIEPLSTKLKQQGQLEVDDSQPKLFNGMKRQGIRELSKLLDHFADPRKPVSGDQRAIVNNILDLPNGRELISFLGRPIIQQQIRGLFSKALSQPGNVDFILTQFESAIGKITKEQWIETSGLSSTNFLKWVAEGRFAPNFLIAPSRRETISFKGPQLRMEAAADFAILKNDRNRFVNSLTDQLKGGSSIDLGRASKSLETFAKKVEATRLKYGDVERRYSHNLRGPFYSGLSTEILFEHHKFLREEVAVVEALKLFLDPNKRDLPLSKTKATDGEITIGQAIGQGIPIAEILVRLDETPEVKKILDESNEILEKVRYWGDASAKKQSFEGSITLAREFYEQVNREGKQKLRSDQSPEWDAKTFNKAIELADHAIKSANQSHLLQFAVTGAWMGVVGYFNTKAQNIRLQEARQLKIDICRSAYLASPDKTSDQAKLALKTALETAQELGKTRETKISALQKAISSYLGRTEEISLWKPERSDTSLKGFSDLFIFHGIKEAGEEILKVLEAKKKSGKPLSDMDIQHLVLIGLALPDLANRAMTIGPDAAGAFAKIRDAIKSENPDLNTLSLSVPILQSLSSYYKNRAANFSAEADTIRPSRKRIDALLKQIPRATRAEALIPQYLRRLPEIMENRKVFQDAMTKGATFKEASAMKETVNEDNTFLTEILSACRKDSIWGAKGLLQLLNAGVMEARGPFVELISERLINESVETAPISKDELQALAFMSVTGSMWARDLIIRLQDRFPAASVFITNPSRAVLGFPSNVKGDLSLAEMKKALVMAKDQTQILIDSLSRQANLPINITPIIVAAQRELDDLNDKKGAGTIDEDEYNVQKSLIELTQQLALDESENGNQQIQQELERLNYSEYQLEALITLEMPSQICSDFKEASGFIEKHRADPNKLMLIFRGGLIRRDQELLKAAGGVLLANLKDRLDPILQRGERVTLTNPEFEFLSNAKKLDESNDYGNTFKDAGRLLSEVVGSMGEPISPAVQEQLDERGPILESRPIPRGSSVESLEVDFENLAQELGEEAGRLAPQMAEPLFEAERPASPTGQHEVVLAGEELATFFDGLLITDSMPNLVEVVEVNPLIPSPIPEERLSVTSRRGSTSSRLTTVLDALRALGEIGGDLLQSLSNIA